MEDRIIKGFDYFYNMKPSEFKKVDVVYLHHWMDLFRRRIEEIKTRADLKTIPDVPETDDQLYDVAKMIFS